MAKVFGIIFDVDGTLFDTASLIYDAYDHLAEVYGYEKPNRKQVASLIGRPIPEIIDALFPGVDVPAMMETNMEFVVKNASTVLAYEGLHEMLEGLKLRKIRMGILTSGSKKVLNLIEHHTVGDYFASVVYADRIVKVKPDPEGFELALKEMGTRASETIMVGDLPPDVQVGKKGGALATIGVTHGFGTKTVLKAAGADYIIDSLHELVGVVDAIEEKA